MELVETASQDLVATARGVVESLPRAPIVAEVLEQASLGVEAVRPVRLGARRVQDCQSILLASAAAVDPEATLIPARQQAGERVVAGIPTGAT
jgi:hypothetical protein